MGVSGGRTSKKIQYLNLSRPALYMSPNRGPSIPFALLPIPGVSYCSRLTAVTRASQPPQMLRELRSPTSLATGSQPFSCKLAHGRADKAMPLREVIEPLM